MDENLKKKLMMEEMLELDEIDIAQGMKNLYNLFKSAVDAGFTEAQAMAIILSVLGNAAERR